MRRWLGLVAGFLALTLLGAWLWWREGLDVWIDAVIAFCT